MILDEVEQLDVESKKEQSLKDQEEHQELSLLSKNVD